MVTSKRPPDDCSEGNSRGELGESREGFPEAGAFLLQVKRC